MGAALLKKPELVKEVKAFIHNLLEVINFI